MSTAVATQVELVRFAPESSRARLLFEALCGAAASSGVEVVRTPAYRGISPWLLLWGPGAPERASVLQRHVAAGGHVLAWDLAYWDRDHKARVSIDAAHPSAWVMRQPFTRDRLLADRVPVADAWSPTGPVIVAGLGDKARVQYGAPAVDAWERQMIAICRERWPGRPIVYRKKKAGSPVPADLQVSSLSTPIDEALKEASLLITWHSNVAVDAIRMGIPVICRDGAAAAVCQSAFGETDPMPLPVDVRDQFLANLAHFQWAPSEAAACWRFLHQVLP
ncbi:MAG: hypothetical protein AB7R67_18980 [Vicinamibacterales bacterium]